MRITLTLQSAYTGNTDIGPFTVSGTTNGGSLNGVNMTTGSISREQLISGWGYDDLDDTITGGTINSSGTCNTGVTWTATTTTPTPTPTGATSVLLGNDFILGNTEMSTCPGTGTPFGVYISQSDYDNRYSQSGIKFITLYQDESLSTLWTGYSFVYVIGDTGEINEVYELNTSTGQIGNSVGEQPC